MRSEIINKALNLLTRRDKVKIVGIVIGQCILSFLDLLGVALIGILGALTVSGIQSRAPIGTIAKIVDGIGLAQFPFQKQVAILALSASVTLVVRTLFSIVTTRKVLGFLGSRAAIISTELLRKLLNQSLTSIRKRSSQKTIYALTDGVTNITIGIIGNIMTITSDFALLLVLAIGLLVVNSTVAISTVVFFALVALFLNKFLHGKAGLLGESQGKLSVQSNENIAQVVQAYREIFVRNRRGYYAKSFSKLREEFSKNLAEVSFLPYVGKYVIEIAVVLGSLAISGIQFAITDAEHAVATLSIFLAAGTRIAPAVLRIQQSSVQLRAAMGSSEFTFEMIEELETIEPIELEESAPLFSYPEFKSTVCIREASYSYPDSERPSLKSVSLEIARGSAIALVGPSGGGKTTLADLLLGVLTPSSGEVQISGLEPQKAIERFPGAIAYVPQDSLIMDGTILSNVALGYPIHDLSIFHVTRALEIAQLLDLVNEMPKKLETLIGERGTNLSGGQRQRLGIARALYTNPQLIVLDEATSALDGKTEHDFTNALMSLKGSVTLVIIAHRISTVKECDVIYYVEDGRIKARGTFDRIRQEVPEFSEQILLQKTD